MIACLLLIAFNMLAGGSPSQQPVKSEKEPVLLWIDSEPPDSDWVAPGFKDRLDSANDLRRAMEGDSGVFRLAPSRAEAHIIVEITERSETESGRVVGFVHPNGFVHTKRLAGRSVKAKVMVQDHEFEIAGTTDKRYWRNAAGDLAKELRRWAEANYDRIMSTIARRD